VSISGASAQVEAVSPVALRRKITVIALTFVITAAVTGAGLSIVFGLLQGGIPIDALMFALQLSFFAAAIAAAIVALPIDRAMRDATGRDLGRSQAFKKIVLQKKNIPLVPGDEPAAARYAALASAALSFQLVFFVVLYAGILLGQVPRLFDGDVGWFSKALVGIMVVALLVLVPMLIRQVRRARRYVREHPIGPELPTP
jgi:hypothetical protein